MTVIFDSIGKAISESKQFTPGINLPISVTGYERVGDRDYVVGINLLSDDLESREAIVRAFLLDDKDAATRENPRASLLDRKDPSYNGYVGPGGTMILEQAYKQADGTYASKWTTRISSDADSGLAVKYVLGLRFVESKSKDKKPQAIITWFNPSSSIRVTNEATLKAALKKHMDGHLAATTPVCMVRVTTAGNAHAELIQRKKNKDADYALVPFEDTYSSFINSPVGMQILKALQSPESESMCFEVIRGGVGFHAKMQREKFFRQGALVQLTKSGADSEGKILRDIFQPLNAQGVRDDLFCVGVVGITKTKNTKDKEGHLFYRYAKPATSLPKMFEVKYMQTEFFTPNDSVYKTANANIEFDADGDHDGADKTPESAMPSQPSAASVIPAGLVTGVRDI